MLFGSSSEKAVAHLKAAIQRSPDSTVNHYFLAEVLADTGRREDARAELQKVLDAPFDPDWTPEDREWKAKAKAMLSRL